MDLQSFVQYPVIHSAEELEKTNPIKPTDFCADGKKETIFERVKEFFSFFGCILEIDKNEEGRSIFYIKKESTILGTLKFESYQRLEKVLIKIIPNLK